MSNETVTNWALITPANKNDDTTISVTFPTNYASLLGDVYILNHDSELGYSVADKSIFASSDGRYATFLMYATQTLAIKTDDLNSLLPILEMNASRMLCVSTCLLALE